MNEKIDNKKESVERKKKDDWLQTKPPYQTKAFIKQNLMKLI